MTLDDIAVGRTAVLGKPGMDPARARRLAELGLRLGANVTVMHRTAGRGRVVGVDDARIALDRRTLRAFPVLDVQPPEASPASA